MNPRWLAGKVAAALLTFAFVVVFNFFLFRVMGDPTAQLARLPRATPQEIEKLKANYGLDKPITGQFVDYAGDTLRLDFGISQRTRRSVWTEIKEALPWTLLLVGTGTLLATLIGAWLGVIAATRRGKPADDGLLGFSLFTYAAPEYWVGIDPDPRLRRLDPDPARGPADDAWRGVLQLVRCRPRTSRST